MSGHKPTQDALNHSRSVQPPQLARHHRGSHYRTDRGGELGGKDDLNEADLGAKLNVSCVPLREALRIL